jgi:phosphoenolpyruvate carboxylase
MASVAQELYNDLQNAIKGHSITNLNRQLNRLLDAVSADLEPDKKRALQVQLLNLASDVVRYNQAHAAYEEIGNVRPIYPALGDDIARDTMLSGVVPHFRPQVVITAHPTETLSAEAIWLVRELKQAVFDIADGHGEHIETIGAFVHDLANVAILAPQPYFRPDTKKDWAPETSRYYRIKVDGGAQNVGSEILLQPDAVTEVDGDITLSPEQAVKIAERMLAFRLGKELWNHENMADPEHAVLLDYYGGQEGLDTEINNLMGRMTIEPAQVTDYTLQNLGEATNRMTVRGETRRASEYALSYMQSVPVLMGKLGGLRGLDVSTLAALRNGHGSQALSDFYRLFTVSSWAGGDRDSKPNVTAHEIYESMWQYRRDALGFYLMGIDELIGQIPSNALSNVEDAVERLLKRKEQLHGLIRQSFDVGHRSFEAFDPKEFLEFLEELRPILNPYLPKHEEAANATHLDILTVQAAIMGGQSCSIQMRQNRSEHVKAFEQLLNMVNEGRANPFTKAAQLIAACRSTSSSSLRMRVQEWVNGLPETDPVYQVLMGCAYAAQYPDAIPEYIIAECENSEDVRQLKAMLELMTPVGEKCHVAIIPLFEGTESIRGTKNITTELFKNNWFSSLLDDAEDVVHSLPPEALQELAIELGMYDTEALQARPVTARDVIHALGMSEGYATGSLGIKPEELDTPITKEQTIMFAGSDSIKSSGVAIIPQLERAKEHALIQGLRRGVLVRIYAGEGGSVARKEGGYEQVATVQGRSSRDLVPEEFADYVENVQVYNIDRLLSGRSEEGSKRGRASAKHISANNITRQTRETEEQWAVIRNRSVEGVEEYRRQFGQEPAVDNDFKAYYQNASGDAAAKAANFSARPPKREGADYVHHTARAIGYNLAMNIAGSCAPLYLGMANFVAGCAYSDNVSLQAMSGLVAIALSGQNLHALYEQTHASTKVQETILRTSYGLAMADFDTAWKYLGCSFDAETGNVIDAEGNAYDLMSLLLCNVPEARQLARFQLEHSFLTPIVTALLHDVQADRGPNQLQALADGMLDVARVAREGNRDVNLDILRYLQQNGTREALLNAMPGGLAEELALQMPLADLSRMRVQEMNESIKAVKISGEAFPEGYEAMHAAIDACVEVFERAPSYFMDAALVGNVADALEYLEDVARAA